MRPIQHKRGWRRCAPHRASQNPKRFAPPTPEDVGYPAYREHRPHPHSRMMLALISAIYISILVEDALRKTVGLPGAILIVKDIVLLVLYCIYLPRCMTVNRKFWARVAVVGGLLLVWITVEATLPAAGLGTFLLGLKTYLLYVPLLCIGRLAFADERTRNRAVTGLTLGGTAIGAAAVVSALFRSNAPPLLRPIAEDVATHSYTYGEVFLAPSIFATGEKAADQLLLATLAAATLVLKAKNTRRRAIALAALAVCLGGLFATARRTPLILAIVGLLLLFVHGNGASSRKRPFPLASTAAGLLIVATVSVAAVGILGIRGFVGYITDARNGVMVVQQFASLPDDALALEGNGSGTATQGAAQLGLKPPTYFGESEGIVAKVWFELGPVGFGLYALLIWLSLHSVMRARRTIGLAAYSVMERAALLFVVAVLVMALKAYQQFDNAQVQILFWLAAGFASRCAWPEGIKQVPLSSDSKVRPVCNTGYP